MMPLSRKTGFHISSWLFCSLLWKNCSAVLQTLALDVYIDGVELGAPKYTMLASQAFYGPLPPMTAKANPTLSVTKAPEDNPLLCDQATNTGLGLDGSIVLVPRGQCTFEQKTRNAALLGAKAVIIYGTLESRYSLNSTRSEEASSKDIIFPLQYYDFDCQKGKAYVPASSLSFEPLPYNAEQNDPKLSGTSSANLCLLHAVDQLENCPSKACLLTGNYSESNSEEMEACCAWDLPIWLFGDIQLENATRTITKIPSAYLTMEQSARLLKAIADGSSVSVTLYSRWQPQYNISSILIWALGVTVAALAAYLSASDYRDLMYKTLRRRERASRPRSAGGRPPTNQNAPSHRDSPTPTEELTAAHALVFIVVASGSLLFIFFFKVYGLLKIFYAMGCSTALAQVILHPSLRCIMKKLQWRDSVVWRTGTEDFGDISVRDILALGIAYSIGLVWIVMAFTMRKAEMVPFFWITQNVFGTCMCIMFLKTIRLNSIRVASILLIIFFFYDIFFVFVTPLIFNGESVMISVATSGGPPKADPSWCEKYPDDRNCQGGEPMPMLLTVPRLFDYQGGVSLLGLGDIVMPGLLLSFAARFDAAKSLLGVLSGGGPNGSSSAYNCPEQRWCIHWKICRCTGGYFAPSMVAYAIGLLMANLAVYLMNMGQPALLYLVPACLGTVCFIGWRRGELKDLWDGPKIIRAAEAEVYGEDAAVPGQLMPVPMEEGHDVEVVPSAEEGGEDPLIKSGEAA